MMRFFAKTTRSITGAAVLLAIASLTSRMVGVIRDRIFAHYYGAGIELDMYNAAFKIPDLVYQLVVIGALSAGFIPVFLGVYKKNQAQAWQLTSALITLFGGILSLFCIAMMVAAPWFVPLIVPGFEAEALEQTIVLTRIMCLSPLLMGISGIIGGVLQSCKAFFIYALAPILYNVGIIIGAIGFTPYLGLSGLAWGVILGAALHLLIQIPTLRLLGFNYSVQAPWNTPELKEIATLMVPRMLSLGVHQFSVIAQTILASTLIAGSISILTFATNIQYVPVGIIGYSFAIAAFPTLAGYAAEGKFEDIRHHLSATIRQIIFLILPLTLTFLVLRAQIVRVLLGTGSFDWGDTIATADAIAVFSLSLFAQCLIPLFSRAFYALSDTATPFIVGLISTAIHIGLALALKGTYGVLGLAAAFSIGSIIQVIFLGMLLRYRLKSFEEKRLVILLAKVTVAGYMMAIVMQLTKSPVASFVDMTRFWGIALQGTIAGTAGIITYATLCLALQLEEMHEFAASLKKRFLKFRGEEEIFIEPHA
jgi:putative peptidoglycan lipid II flippase